MANTKTTSITKSTTPRKPKTKQIPIEAIVFEVDNHRQAMDPAKLVELTASLQDVGLLNAIGVMQRPSPGGEIDPVFVLIWGHRRLKAAIELGWTQIKAEVYRDLTALQIAEMQFIENLQREDLSPLDEAIGIKALLDAGQEIEVVAERIDRSEEFVRRRLDLLRLAPEVADLVRSGRIPIKHGVLIARVGDVAQQVELAKGVVCGGYYNPAALVTIAAESDYVEPLEALRKSVTYRLKTLGNKGWPMNERYAGMRPCLGCPDNTATEPTLFDGVDLPGKSVKGNCTNQACFDAKMKPWGKDVDTRKKAEAAAQKKLDAARAKRKKAGQPNVCWRCACELGAINAGKGICAKCFKAVKKEEDKAKAKKKREAGGYSSRSPKRDPFPNNAQERYDLALVQWANAAGEKIIKELRANDHRSVADEFVALAIHLARMTDWGELYFRCEEGQSAAEKNAPKRADELIAKLGGHGRVMLLTSDRPLALDVLAATIAWDEPADFHRAIDVIPAQQIRCLPAIAEWCGVEIDPPPTPDQFQPKPDETADEKPDDDEKKKPAAKKTAKKKVTKKAKKAVKKVTKKVTKKASK